jgi:hypothetical protein
MYAFIIRIVLLILGDAAPLIPAVGEVRQLFLLTILQKRLRSYDSSCMRPTMADRPASGRKGKTPMTEDQIRARVAEIDEKIANAKQWGAMITALDEERRGLLRLLSSRQTEGTVR